MGAETAAFKMCASSERASGLGAMNFTELQDFAKQYEIDIGHLAQWAYPTWGPEYIDEVLSFFGIPALLNWHQLRYGNGADLTTYYPLQPASANLKARLR